MAAMDSIKGTTARLRRTFHYPTDDSSSTDSPEVMDEEEQESLIQNLAWENTARNAQFRLLLLALPLLSTLPYLLTLFRPSTFLLSLLSLTSLLSTAYLLYVLPPTHTGIRVLDDWAQGPVSASSPPHIDEHEDDGGSSSSSSYNRPSRKKPRTSSFSFTEHKSPLEMHLPLLNAGLCVVLALMGLLTRGAGEHALRFGRVGLGNLPGIVYGVVLVAKMVMASVDPERELGGLRYEYKGA